MDAVTLFNAGFSDLVSVMPPGGKVSPLSKVKPDSVGKAPGRLGKNGWAGYDWKTHTTTLQDAERMVKDGANIGLQARNFPAIDIDCTDASIATIVEKVARETLGTAPSRTGRAPKRLLMYRTEQPFGRMRVWMKGSDGVQHLVECLADGQQYVISGIHPATKKPYEWDENLISTGPLALTAITRDQVAAFFDELTNQLSFLDIVCERDGTGQIKDMSGIVVPQDALKAPSLDALADCVALLPNDVQSYDEYVEVGIAIKAAGQEDESRALAIFQEWAARWTNGANDPDNVERDFARMRPPFRIGWDWLGDRAKAYGYNPATEEFHVQDPENDEPTGQPVEYSDASMASRLIGRHGHDIKYCDALGGWLVWDGRRWSADETMQVHYWAGELLRDASSEVILRNDFNAAKVDRISSALASNAARNNCVNYAKADRRIVARAEDFDADRMLLNTPGGVVDLKTGNIRDRIPGELLIRSTAIAPDMTRRPSHWIGFLNQATGGDKELQGYLQRLAGYCLTGQTVEQNITFIHGTGGTGKSVFTNTVSGILGDYAMKSQMETFVSSTVDRHPTELARLRGARMVFASETQQGRRWNEGRLKELSGEEAITARFMHKDEFSYMPQFKLLFLGNHKPELRNIEGGIRRRLHLVPFNIKPERPDVHLQDKLKSEWPLILGWAIEGCLAWQLEGLNPPAAVLAATEEYFEDEDAIGRWLDERCETGADAFAVSGALYDDWRAWCAENGEHAGSQKRLTTELKTRGFEYHRTASSRGFNGLRLKFGAEFNVVPFKKGA